MTRFVLALTAIALTFSVGAATAGTIQDLAAVGYTVSISNPGPSGANCPTYYISGHGVGTYMNCNTAQADIDSLANPATICNADWQISHPDQLDAVNRIRGEGWSITGDQCADIYTVSNPSDGSVAYSGPGAGLVSLDPGVPAASQTPSTPGGGSTPTSSGQCLPLCSGTTTATSATPDSASMTTVTSTTATTPDAVSTASDSSPRWTPTRIAV